MYLPVYLGDDMSVKCRHCHNDIEPGQKWHRSTQPGMEGNYHWRCYLMVARSGENNPEIELALRAFYKKNRTLEKIRKLT